MTLRLLDAADMFDVLHVMYEEDITPMWESHIEVKDQVREAVYGLLYGKKYEFSTRNASAAAGPEGFPEAAPGHVGTDPAKAPPKPYIPPSSEEDLMKVLDAPLG